MKEEICLCDTKKPYAECCGRYHKGALPESALTLMRSRYCAYAKGIVDYIIQTTHPNHPDWHRPLQEWKREIRLFSENTRFVRLEILAFVEGETVSFVTFTAHLTQDGHDRSFTECSRFEKVAGKWYYVEAVKNL